MITGLIVWILNVINASPEQLAQIMPNISDPETLDKLAQLGIYSYLDTIPKSHKSIAYIVLGFEFLIEFYTFMRFLPTYLKERFERIRNRSIHDAEILKAIKYKIENNVALSKKEKKFYAKQIKQKQTQKK